jgi:hypothetical protein
MISLSKSSKLMKFLKRWNESAYDDFVWAGTQDESTNVCKVLRAYSAGMLLCALAMSALGFLIVIAVLQIMMLVYPLFSDLSDWTNYYLKFFTYATDKSGDLTLLQTAQIAMCLEVACAVMLGFFYVQHLVKENTSQDTQSEPTAIGLWLDKQHSKICRQITITE